MMPSYIHMVWGFVAYTSRSREDIPMPGYEEIFNVWATCWMTESLYTFPSKDLLLWRGNERNCSRVSPDAPPSTQIVKLFDPLVYDTTESYFDKSIHYVSCTVVAFLRILVNHQALRLPDLGGTLYGVESRIITPELISWQGLLDGDELLERRHNKQYARRTRSDPSCIHLR